MSTVDTRLSERLDALSPTQREILLTKLKKKKRTQQTTHFSVHQPIVHVKQNTGHYTLSSGQQRLWFLEQLDPGKPTYHIASALNLEGSLNLFALKHALQTIIDRHDSLRTTFVNQHEGVFQRITDKSTAVLARMHLNEASLNAALEKEMATPFDLLNGPLFRVTLFKLSDQRHVLSFVLHHIISDAWSCQVLLSELSILYNQAIHGDVHALPELPCQYTDFARWQSELFAQPVIEKQRSFWLKALEGIEPLSLPYDHSRPKTISYQGDFIKVDLQETEVNKFTELCHTFNVTLFHGLMSVFQALLFRYTQQRHFCIGTPVAGRNHEDTQGLIGFFVNSLAITNDATADITFAELLTQVKNTTLDAQSHQDIPFESIVEALDLPRDTSVAPIFQVFFSYNPDNNQAQCALTALETSLIPMDNQTAKFDLSLIVHTTDNGLSCHFEYNTDIFERSTLMHLTDAFKCLLNDACDKPSHQIKDLSLLNNNDKQTLLTLGQAPNKTPLETDIATLFERQVERTPHKIAIVEGEQSITFDKLNHRANQLAHVLMTQGITKGSHVGVSLLPSIDLMVALIATVKMQATYIPMEPHWPVPRLQGMVDDAGISLVLTQATLEDLSVNQFCLDAIKNTENRDNPARHHDENLPLYMLYTSGSTGRPKAASVSHLNASNLYHWYKETFTLSADDKLLVFSSIGFDLTQKNLWASLCFGAELHFTGCDYYDPVEINRTIKTQAISWINCAPSAFYPLIDHCRDFVELASLKQVFLGGESIQLSQLHAWLDHSTTHAALVNMYGPTECTDIATFYRHKKTDKKLPIGRPINNVQLYVVDKNLHLLPKGAIGELCIAGTSTGLGYHNNDARNASAFVTNPYSQSQGDKSLYRTGDLVRYKSNDGLEFIARNDSQMKIRGFRVEPEEIEAAIKQLPGIKDAVVALRQNQQQEQLIAYMMSPSDLASAQFYRQSLGQILADFMIPSAFVKIDSIPVNVNGKVDRKLLPDIDMCRAEENTYIAPRNALEAEIVDIWKNLLAIDKIGVTDNFFHSGGHSLMATQLLIRIRERFFIDLPMRTLFEISTIEGLAEIIFAMQQNHEHLDEDVLEEGIL